MRPEVHGCRRGNDDRQPVRHEGQALCAVSNNDNCSSRARSRRPGRAEANNAAVPPFGSGPAGWEAGAAAEGPRKLYHRCPVEHRASIGRGDSVDHLPP